MILHHLPSGMILQVPSGKLTYRHGKDLIFPGVCLYDVEMLDFSSQPCYCSLLECECGWKKFNSYRPKFLEWVNFSRKRKWPNAGKYSLNKATCACRQSQLCYTCSSPTRANYLKKTKECHGKYEGEHEENMESWWFKVTFLGWLSDPFKGLSDLQLGDEKGTLNHLDDINFRGNVHHPTWSFLHRVLVRVFLFGGPLNKPCLQMMAFLIPSPHVPPFHVAKGTRMPVEGRT